MAEISMPIMLRTSNLVFMAAPLQKVRENLAECSRKTSDLS
jgi:hypothetical protein